jgi:hypothetical protein
MSVYDEIYELVLYVPRNDRKTFDELVGYDWWDESHDSFANYDSNRKTHFRVYTRVFKQTPEAETLLTLLLDNIREIDAMKKALNLKSLHAVLIGSDYDSWQVIAGQPRRLMTHI